MKTTEEWNDWETQEAIRIMDEGEVAPGQISRAYAKAGHKRLLAERDALRAEVERLRAALTDTVEDMKTIAGFARNSTQTVVASNLIEKAARAALEGSK